MTWKRIKDHLPKSAKVMPVWIRDPQNNDKLDLVYLTEDEKYFISIDHKMVYLVDDVIFWTMVDVPLYGG